MATDNRQYVSGGVGTETVPEITVNLCITVAAWALIFWLLRVQPQFYVLLLVTEDG